MPPPLFDDDGGYWIGRLDSILAGGEPRYERVQDAVRVALAREKSLDRAIATAQLFSTAAATAGFEAAAKAANLTVIKSPAFTRVEFVPGLGQFTRAIGAAFGLPVGAVSAPIRTPDGVFVLRVERRTLTDRVQFDKQMEGLQRQHLQQQRQRTLQLFRADIRKSAKIVDHRKEIYASARRQAT